MKGPGYSIEVPWSVRFTWSGDYLHDAYWSVGQQGFTNVSHGCVNMPPADAESYYKMAVPGDPVTITGSPRAACSTTAGRCGSYHGGAGCTAVHCTRRSASQPQRQELSFTRTSRPEQLPTSAAAHEMHTGVRPTPLRLRSHGTGVAPLAMESRAVTPRTARERGPRGPQAPRCRRTAAEIQLNRGGVRARVPRYGGTWSLLAGCSWPEPCGATGVRRRNVGG